MANVIKLRKGLNINLDMLLSPLLDPQYGTQAAFDATLKDMERGKFANGGRLYAPGGYTDDDNAVYDKTVTLDSGESYPARMMNISGQELPVFLANDNKMYAVGNDNKPFEIWSKYSLPEVTVTPSQKKDANGDYYNANTSYYNSAFHPEDTSRIFDTMVELMGDYTKNYGFRAAQKMFGTEPDSDENTGSSGDLVDTINNLGSNIYYYLDNNISFKPLRGLLSTLDQEGQSLTNGISSAFNNFSKGNLLKGASNIVGVPMDFATTYITSPLMQYAPSYAMPAKDIPISLYNKVARKLTGDPSFTAIKGHIYSNLDFSPEFNTIAQKVVKSANEDYSSDGGKNTINSLIKQNVSSNLDYGSSRLLLYPFNSTAGYAWTIGRVAPHSTSHNYYTEDAYDNNNTKTWHYLNKASINNPTDWVRGIGGLFTSWDTDPDDGKQTIRLKYSK